MGGGGVDTAIWGKSRGLASPYPLMAHLTDTAAVCFALLDQLPANTRRLLTDWDPDQAKVSSSLAFIAGAHDLGKVSPWQDRDPAAMARLIEAGYETTPGRRVDHDHATQLTLPEALKELGVVEQLGTFTSGALGLACMLGGHHGTFHGPIDGEGPGKNRQNLAARNRPLWSPGWRDQRLAHLAALRDAVSATDVPRIAGERLVVATGLVIVSDWLASAESFVGQPPDWPDWPELDWSIWFKERTEQAHQAINDAGLVATRFHHLGFEETFGFSPRPLQASLTDHFEDRAPEPGIVVITAPMGEGKTEAALTAARALGGPDAGLLITLPTTATADAMFDRIARYVEATSASPVADLALIHSRAAFHAAYERLPDIGNVVSDDRAVQLVCSSWLRGRNRGMLASVATATIDQLLVLALRARRGSLRLFGLAGKVVVIDEAHALDAYMHGLLELTLTWLGRLGVPVVILSATLPSRVSRELVAAWQQGAGSSQDTPSPPYPGWTHASGSSDPSTSQLVESRRTELAIRCQPVDEWTTSWMDAAQAHLVPIEDEGCALVVCNTVADAQALAMHLAPWADRSQVDLRCLHSRFPLDDRQSLTQAVLDAHGPPRTEQARPARSVVVATQVVEQSFDVDFDIVVSCLAPIAPLLQRAGRGHRHARPRPAALAEPTLVVLVPIDGPDLALPRPWRYVYPAVYLERTWGLALAEGARRTVVLPDDVQALVDHVYGDLEYAEDDPALQAQLDQEWLTQHTCDRDRIPTPDALSSLAEMTATWDEGVVIATRLGVDSQTVVCCYQAPGGLALDPLGATPLPSRPDRAGTQRVLGRSVPIRRSPVTEAVDRAFSEQRPAGWADNPWLQDALLVILAQNHTCTTGGFEMGIDPLIGFHHRRTA